MMEMLLFLQKEPVTAPEEPKKKLKYGDIGKQRRLYKPLL